MINQDYLSSGQRSMMSSICREYSLKLEACIPQLFQLGFQTFEQLSFARPLHILQVTAFQILVVISVKKWSVLITYRSSKLAKRRRVRLMLACNRVDSLPGNATCPPSCDLPTR